MTPVTAPDAAGARVEGAEPPARRQVGAHLPGLVLGGHVTALGVVRCLAPHGIECYLVSAPGDYAAWSRWARRLPDSPVESPDPAPLAEFLDRVSLESALLLPCSDNWLRAVAALPVSLRERFPAPVAPLTTLERFLDKASFGALVEELDVPHPRTEVVHEGEEREVLERFDFDAAATRFFLKPPDSQRFVQEFGVKALAVRDRDEALERLSAVWRAGFESMLMQEYIPGPASSHYFVDGFRSAESRTVGRLARRRIRMFPRDFGNSTYHETVPLDDLSGAPAELERLLDAVGFRGIFSAEFKRDERDGGLKILEVNVRPWWFVEFAASAGVNVCELAHREALGLPLRPLVSYTVGARCVLPGADVRAYVAQRRERRLGLVVWLASWRGASRAVFSLRDPLPGILQLKEVGTRWWARRLRAGARDNLGR